ncbi:hypothetical protein GGU45_001993 [Niabella hirudinis]
MKNVNKKGDSFVKVNLPAPTILASALYIGYFVFYISPDLIP